MQRAWQAWHRRIIAAENAEKLNGNEAISCCESRWSDEATTAAICLRNKLTASRIAVYLVACVTRNCTSVKFLYFCGHLFSMVCNYLSCDLWVKFVVVVVDIVKLTTGSLPANDMHIKHKRVCSAHKNKLTHTENTSGVRVKQTLVTASWPSNPQNILADRKTNIT